MFRASVSLKTDIDAWPRTDRPELFCTVYQHRLSVKVLQLRLLIRVPLTPWLRSDAKKKTNIPSIRGSLTVSLTMRQAFLQNSMLVESLRNCKHFPISINEFIQQCLNVICYFTVRISCSNINLVTISQIATASRHFVPPSLSKYRLRQSFPPAWRSFDRDGSFKQAIRRSIYQIADGCVVRYYYDTLFSPAVPQFHRNRFVSPFFCQRLYTMAGIMRLATPISFGVHRVRGDDPL